MYLKVYKCFMYRKQLKFNYMYTTYRRNVASTLSEVNYRINYHIDREYKRFPNPERYISETNPGYGRSIDLIAELNGIHCSMIVFYSDRDLSK